MTQKPPLPVVAAVIERDGLVLVAQRPPGKHLALKWEFPGGKIEAGETPAAALDITSARVSELRASPVEHVFVIRQVGRQSRSLPLIVELPAQV